MSKKALKISAATPSTVKPTRVSMLPLLMTRSKTSME